MKEKNFYIIAGAVVVILIALFAIKPKATPPPAENSNKQEQEKTPSPVVAKKTNQPVNKDTSKKNEPPIIENAKNAKLPDIDFVIQSPSFTPKDFPNVKITIERVVIGRGEIAVSTGCTGVPNTNFSTYLYPGSGICISTDKIDGAERGIIAFHLLIENNGDIGFGGNSDTFKVHYLRPDSSQNLVSKFAIPLVDSSKYYVSGYSSKNIILSYLIPGDQLKFDLVYNYKEPFPLPKTLNVFDYSLNGLSVDFGIKDIAIVK